MVGMFEAFELDCFPLKSLKNIAACSPGCPSWRMRGEITDGTSASRRRRPGIWKSSQLVIARGAESARQHYRHAGSQSVGNLSTDMAGIRAGTEPSRIRTSDYSREIAVTRLRQQSLHIRHRRTLSEKELSRATILHFPELLGPCVCVSVRAT